LKTTDHGALVGTFEVGKERGHGGDAMVKRVYGHLGTVRPTKVVEYRVERRQTTVACGTNQGSPAIIDTSNDDHRTGPLLELCMRFAAELKEPGSTTGNFAHWVAVVRADADAGMANIEALDAALRSLPPAEAFERERRELFF
jgi:hypothetical protein